MAYVVGFVTAYIAFGASQVDEAKVVYVTSVNTAQAEQSVDTMVDEAVAGANNTASVVGAFYDNGMLSVSSADGEMVLSVDPDVMPELVDDPQFANQGLHQSPPVYVASSAGEYVYFCEEYTTPGTCRSFVYSIADEMIFPVTFAGERTEISIADANTATWNGTDLQINEYVLTTSDEIWDMSIN